MPNTTTNTSPCATCTRGCCQQYLVTVTGYDAWVIANGMHLAFEQFLVAVPQKEPGARGFYLDRSGRTFDIALDKQMTESDDKPCVFWLALPGGIGRCGIYQLRPFVCQTYPAYLPGGEVRRRGDVLCPEDAWRDGVLDRPFWRERLLRMQVEFDIYNLVVSRWNYHVEHTTHPERLSVQGYFTYLMNYYARLEPLRATLTGDEWKAMCAVWGICYTRGVSPLVVWVDEMTPWAHVVEGVREVAHAIFTDELADEEALIDEETRLKMLEISGGVHV